jgi:hypothetical protein
MIRSYIMMDRAKRWRNVSTFWFFKTLMYFDRGRKKYAKVYHQMAVDLIYLRMDRGLSRTSEKKSSN